MASGEAKLFIGVNVKSIYNEENLFEEITQYDINTGQPYLKKIYKGTIHSFGENINITCRNSYNEYKEYFKNLGLDIINKELLGIKITECEEQDLWEGTLEQVNEAKCKLQTILDNLGWEFPIKLYLDTEFYND